jgi:hypothetical protein
MKIMASFVLMALAVSASVSAQPAADPDDLAVLRAVLRGRRNLTYKQAWV